MLLLPRRRTSRWAAGLALVAVLAVSGCGSSTGTVTGTVKRKDGTVLKGGNVALITSKGQSFSSPIGENGTYTVEKVPVGDVKITVETETLNPARSAARKYSAPPSASGSTYTPPDPSAMAKRYVPIDLKCAEQGTTSLTYKVKGGNQTHEITVDPPPGVGGERR